jgi:hypothetical protein
LLAMLERLTAADCDAWVGVTFEVAGLQAPIALLLESVTAVGAPSDQPARQSFSLIFRGPASPLLPQSIYRLESDVAEAVEIFLVPIGRDASSATYEAIFN